MTHRFLSRFLLALAMVSVASADPASDWKDYDNPLVGIHMTVRRDWTEVFIKETSQVGSVTFNVSAQPHATISVIRQKADYPFDMWVSSTVLLQLYEPGYTPPVVVEFAGRKSVKLIGISKDKEGRREETYFVNRAPFIDQIIFSAPADDWPKSEPDFAVVRKSIRWTS